MNPTKILRYCLKRISGREQGSSTIELAIVFPILLLLIVGAAELGRLFYTYTTLSKSTRIGARYLSTSRNAVNGTTDQKTAAKNEARNLVLCGIKSPLATACDNQTKVVPGLTFANVVICDSFSTPCNPPLGGGLLVKYFRVEIQNYAYQPGVYNLSGASKAAASNFYFELRPGSEARWMQQ